MVYAWSSVGTSENAVEAVEEGEHEEQWVRSQESQGLRKVEAGVVDTVVQVYCRTDSMRQNSVYTVYCSTM